MTPGATTDEINSFIDTNYGDHNFIRIRLYTNKVAYGACRTRSVGRVAFAEFTGSC